MNATGTITPGLLGTGPWCDHYTGSLTGAIVFGVPFPDSYNIDGSFYNVGGTWIVAGTFSSSGVGGAFSGQIHLATQPAAGACVTPTGAYFAVGDVLAEHIGN